MSPLQPEVLKTPIERASTDPELFGGLAHVARVFREDFLDEQFLGLLERHVIGRDGGRGGALHAEILHGNDARRGHQYRALNRMTQLPHVAGPEMRLERLTR